MSLSPFQVLDGVLFSLPTAFLAAEPYAKGIVSSGVSWLELLETLFQSLINFLVFPAFKYFSAFLTFYLHACWKMKSFQLARSAQSSYTHFFFGFSQTKIFLYIGEFDRGAILNKKPVHSGVIPSKSAGMGIKIDENLFWI